MRYAETENSKANGIVYTPCEFAKYLASNMVWHYELMGRGKIRILDPAVGDGELVLAILNEIKSVDKNIKTAVVGFETDTSIIPTTIGRICAEHPDVQLEIRNDDFLEYMSVCGIQEEFDLIIANPPYIRTQIMGAGKAQEISRQTGLSGRVDAYYAFLVYAGALLKPDGIAGFITSNKFMTVKSGASVRDHLFRQARILGITDFGDTKIFEASVLPCTIIFGKGNSANTDAEFISIYETNDSGPAHVADSVFDAVGAVEKEGLAQTKNGKRYFVQHGLLAANDSGAPWRLSSKKKDSWLDNIESVTWKKFSDIGKVRVGIKTTADKVFIGPWDKEEEEPELLRPLITHRNAGQVVSRNSACWRVLYPHAMEDGRRVVCDLDQYPVSKKYLEKHREQLGGRKYVTDANRLWYEIWVPQNPDSWKRRKIVFRDIAEKPEFWLDESGGVVNGDCYWIEIKDDVSTEELYLALAVANSRFIEQYYDSRFNNKLYSGKRRFMAQYVNEFPLPDPASPEAQRAIGIVQDIIQNPKGDLERKMRDLDELVGMIFNVIPKQMASLPLSVS